MEAGGSVTGREGWVRLLQVLDLNALQIFAEQLPVLWNKKQEQPC